MTTDKKVDNGQTKKSDKVIDVKIVKDGFWKKITENKYVTDACKYAIQGTFMIGCVVVGGLILRELPIESDEINSDDVL